MGAKRLTLAVTAALGLVTCGTAALATKVQVAQGGVERVEHSKLVTAGLINIDLSGNGAEWAASVPDVAIDPRDAKHIVAIWREIAMPDRKNRPFLCHLAESHDGGASFSRRDLGWGISETPICNAPYVDFGAGGELYVGATLVEMGPINPPNGWHAFGRAVIRKSPDGGRTWGSTVSVIDSSSFAKGAFAPNPAIPDIAKQTPWDGARGIVNRSNGDIYVAGGYPAPPDGVARSQRFFAVSHDAGTRWSPIYAMGSAEFPQRWDSRIIAAPGKMALAYIAGAAPGVPECLCVVFATSKDGSDLKRTLVTRIGHMDTLVHYPPLAADPSRKGTYAIALVSDDHSALTIFTSRDDGAAWTKLDPVVAPAGVVRLSRPAIAYTLNGALVAMWRGQHADGSYDVYMAAASDAQHFGAPVRVSDTSSRPPESLKSDYAVRGDFINVMKLGPDAAHAVWTDWRNGTEAHVVYGRVPLSDLLGK